MGMLQDIGHGMLGTVLFIVAFFVMIISIIFLFGPTLLKIIGVVGFIFGIGLAVASRKKLFGA